MNEHPVDNLTFEQSLSELERVLRALEDGDTGLEESLSRYEAGIRLLKRCYGKLSDAEQRIRLMNGIDDDGSPLLQPFSHQATTPTAAPPPADDRGPTLTPGTLPVPPARRRRKPTDEADLPF